MTTITVSGSSNNSNLVLGSTGASINDSGAVPVSDTHLDNINSALAAFGFDVKFSKTFNPYPYQEITSTATLEMVGTYTGTEINKAKLSGTETLTAVVSSNGEITFNELYWTSQIVKTETFNTKHLALVNLSAPTPLDTPLSENFGPLFLPWILQHLNGDTAYGGVNQGNITTLNGWYMVYIFDTSDNSFRFINVYTGIEGDWTKIGKFFTVEKQYPNILFETKKFVTISKQLVTDKYIKQ
jgi:hypothetical protein